MHAQVAPALPTLVALFVANALFAAGDAVWESQVSSTPPVGGPSPACFALPSVCRWMPRMRRSHRFSSPSSMVRPSLLLPRTGVRLRHAMPRHATRWHGNHAGPFGGQRRSLINCDEVMRSAGLVVERPAVTQHACTGKDLGPAMGNLKLWQSLGFALQARPL